MSNPVTIMRSAAHTYHSFIRYSLCVTLMLIVRSIDLDS
jgi:hypothetical protein